MQDFKIACKRPGQDRNIFEYRSLITPLDRALLNGHRGAAIWLTGLSGSGKSTIAQALDQRMYKDQYRSFVIDGDNIRHGLCSDLGFSLIDRSENIRRVSEVVRLYVEAGMLVISSFISPIIKDRARARELIPKGQFFEIFCDCPISECERRDTKGLYAKARAGLLPDFTGIDSPFEPPIAPELTLKTGTTYPDECVEKIIELLHKNKILEST